jgi:hypothetical protein
MYALVEAYMDQAFAGADVWCTCHSVPTSSSAGTRLSQVELGHERLARPAFISGRIPDYAHRHVMLRDAFVMKGV